MKIRDILLRLMEEHGDNAYSLQEKSGVPQPTTTRFLNGTHSDPSTRTVKKWAKAYGVTESQLRGDVQIPALSLSSNMQTREAVIRSMARINPQWAVPQAWGDD